MTNLDGHLGPRRTSGAPYQGRLVSFTAAAGTARSFSTGDGLSRQHGSPGALGRSYESIAAEPFPGSALPEGSVFVSRSEPRKQRQYFYQLERRDQETEIRSVVATPDAWAGTNRIRSAVITYGDPPRANTRRRKHRDHIVMGWTGDSRGSVGGGTVESRHGPGTGRSIQASGERPDGRTVTRILGSARGEAGGLVPQPRPSGSRPVRTARYDAPRSSPS
jgi:hypothetical protein